MEKVIKIDNYVEGMQEKEKMSDLKLVRKISRSYL